MYNVFIPRNYKELELMYTLLREAKRRGQEEATRVITRCIRTFTRKPVSECRCVKDNGIDGFVNLFPLPEDIETMEDAERYFQEEEYIPMRYAAWDCTGKPFTKWHKVFVRHGRFWCYHAVGMDV